MSSASSSSLTRLPYLHYLRNHIGDLMALHMEMFGWGYGVFCCHAGEHLNKQIKTCEVTETNLDKKKVPHNCSSDESKTIYIYRYDYT